MSWNLKSFRVFATNQVLLSSLYSMQPAQSDIIAGVNSTNVPGLQFVQLSVKELGNNTIGAFITFPLSWLGGEVLLTCAVDARWVSVTMESTRNIMEVVSRELARQWCLYKLCSFHQRHLRMGSISQPISPIFEQNAVSHNCWSCKPFSGKILQLSKPLLKRSLLP
jgi:hypothetical protein